jgi:abequosyltransferase
MLSTASGLSGKKLTIAIPTFGRPKMLAECVARIAVQLDGDSELLVIDNASAVAAEQVLKPFLDSRPALPISIVRNRTNIGANANILRCLELANTDWVWIVGDDDFLTDGAIAAVLLAIRTCPDAIFLSFVATNYKRKGESISCGVSGAIEDLDSFPNLLFISTGVYYRPAMLESLKFGYHFAYSCAPHLAVLFTALGANGKVYWRTETIIHRPPSNEDGHFDFTVKFLGLPTLLELPIPAEFRSVLLKKIEQDLPSRIGLLAFAAALTINDPKNRWIFGHIARRMASTRSSFAGELSISVGELALRTPRLTWWLLDLAARATRRHLIFRDSYRSFQRC